jgi:hypothetical protein
MSATGYLVARVDQDHIGVPGVTSTANATLAAERLPWRWIGVRVAPVGASAAIGVLHPFLGAVVAVVALATALTIIGTAMFGSPELSSRAFRLMCLIGNRPEPSPRSEPAGAQRAQDLAIPPVWQRTVSHRLYREPQVSRWRQEDPCADPSMRTRCRLSAGVGHCRWMPVKHRLPNTSVDSASHCAD